MTKRRYRVGAGFGVFLLLVSSGNSVALSNWARAYGGSESDFFNSLQQTTDGGYVFARSTRSFGAEWNDAWGLKLDSKGRVSWATRYGGTDSSDWDGASSIRQTTDGGYIVVGETWSFGAGSADAWVMRLDGNGNMVWEKTYGGNQGDQADCGRQASDGGFIVAGRTGSYSGRSTGRLSQSVRGQHRRTLHIHRCWNHVAGGSDLVIDPNNASTLYAARHGACIYKSVGYGASWTLINDLDGGLTTTDFARINLAISRTSQVVLFAGMTDTRLAANSRGYGETSTVGCIGPG